MSKKDRLLAVQVSQELKELAGSINVDPWAERSKRRFTEATPNLVRSPWRCATSAA